MSVTFWDLAKDAQSRCVAPEPPPVQRESRPLTVLGVGVDLVHVPTFAEQLEVRGSRFAELFTPGERADIAERGGDARHWAVRWAVKEAVVKAWSTSLFGSEPVMGDAALGQIETVTDLWGRPRVRLHGEVARELAGCGIEVSLSHDGDHAMAYAVLSGRALGLQQVGGQQPFQLDDGLAMLLAVPDGEVEH
jgi:holo-[acyl-carrier protein] synthase